MGRAATAAPQLLFARLPPSQRPSASASRSPSTPPNALAQRHVHGTPEVRSHRTVVAKLGKSRDVRPSKAFLHRDRSDAGHAVSRRCGTAVLDDGGTDVQKRPGAPNGSPTRADSNGRGIAGGRGRDPLRNWPSFSAANVVSAEGRHRARIAGRSTNCPKVSRRSPRSLRTVVILGCASLPSVTSKYTAATSTKRIRERERPDCRHCVAPAKARRRSRVAVTAIVVAEHSEA